MTDCFREKSFNFTKAWKVEAVHAFFFIRTILWGQWQSDSDEIKNKRRSLPLDFEKKENIWDLEAEN